MCRAPARLELPQSPWQQARACLDQLEPRGEEEEAFWAADLLEQDTPFAHYAGPCYGEQTARLMQVHLLASAAADAVLLGQPLPAHECGALLALWPRLLRLTATPPGAAHCSGAPSSPFAAAAHVLLAERPGCPPAAPVTLALPEPQQQDPREPCATACRFELAAPPADADAADELQVFARQLNRAIEHSSKEALEEALSALRTRLPCATAVSAVRSSIESGLSADDTLQLTSGLRTRLLQRSASAMPPAAALSSDGSLGSACTTPLRVSHSLSLPPAQ